MTRHLATIQKILDLQPIAGADLIEVATINGWRAVVKKGEYKVGDLVVYCETDSFIPNDLAPFLSKGQEPREYEGIKGERLRTVKLRGCLSQGLILPVHSDKTGTYLMINDDEHGEYSVTVAEGDDVSEVLGIVKYDPPVAAHLAGIVKGAWPSAIPHTDEERIQNLTNELPHLIQYGYEVTEKLEGSSMSVGLIDGEFFVGSRTVNLRETEGNTFWMLARKYDIENKLRSKGFDNVIFQGEAIGEGIQGNHYGLKGQDFYVYAVFSLATGLFVSPDNRKEFCNSFGLKHVPTIGTFPLQAISNGLGMDPIENILKYADGKSVINPAKSREGVVFKRIDGQEHFKAVSNQYLISNDY